MAYPSARYITGGSHHIIEKILFIIGGIPPIVNKTLFIINETLPIIKDITYIKRDITLEGKFCLYNITRDITNSTKVVIHLINYFNNP